MDKRTCNSPWRGSVGREEEEMLTRYQRILKGRQVFGEEPKSGGVLNSDVLFRHSWADLRGSDLGYDTQSRVSTNA